VGCATGFILQPYTAQHEVHGVDITASQMEIALSRGFKSCQVVDLEGGRLPFADETFDVVLSGETIEHVMDTDWILCEMNRVLKPGGGLVVTVPNVRTPMGIAMMLFLNLPPMMSARYRSTHVRDFTTGTLRLALENCGFRVSKTMGTHFQIGQGNLLPWIARRLPSWSSHIAVQAVREQRANYSPAQVISDFPALKRGEA
jgi:ubiquinone/menaquinone biosynthesis C-methylase UbiE